MLRSSITIIIVFVYIAQSNGFVRHCNNNRILAHIAKAANAVVDPLAPDKLPVSLPAPEPKLQRTDNVVERMALFLLSSILAFSIKTTDRDLLIRNIGFSYNNFVRITKLLVVKSRNIRDVSEAIVKILTSILPKFIIKFFQTNYSKNSRYICEASSLWFTFGFIEWLVGPAERFLTDASSH